MADVEINAQVEKEGQGYPEGGPEQRLSECNVVGPTVKAPKVQGQHDRYQNAEGYPQDRLMIHRSASISCFPSVAGGLTSHPSLSGCAAGRSRHQCPAPAAGAGEC